LAIELSDVIELRITNLMTARVERGTLFLYLENPEKTAREEFVVPFSEIKPSDTITVKQGIGITKTFYHEKTNIGVIRAEMS
jgi:hypothetical protein